MSTQQTLCLDPALHVFHAAFAEYVIATSPEAADATWRERIGQGMSLDLGAGPVAWQQVPDEQELTVTGWGANKVDTDWGLKTTKTCGAWAKEHGRGYFVSARGEDHDEAQ